MHRYGYFGSDSTVFRNNIKNGKAEHAVMMFNGVFDIIDDNRIAIENGFTMTEMFSNGADYTPGCVCSTNLSARLLNYDGALSGFNFQRNFTLFLGVEYSTSKVNLPSYLRGEAKVATKIANLWFWIDEDDNVCIMGTNDHEATSYGGKLTNLVAVQTGSNYYFVYCVGQNKKIVRCFEVTGTSGVYENDAVMSTVDISLSDLAYERISALAGKSTTDRWYLLTNTIFHYEHQITDEGNKIASTTTMFSTINSFMGTKPKKVLGKVIDFEANDWNSKLDKDAEVYIKTTYTSPKSIITIAEELYSPFGMVPQIQYNSSTETSLSGVTYATNPFAGLSGYTYRDLVAYLAESIGLNVRFERIAISFDINTLEVSTVPIPRFTYVLGSGYTLGQDEIYDYDTEEYITKQIQKIVVRQTENDIGVQYPADAAANANTWNIVDNPLLAPYETEQAIRDRTVYIWQRTNGKTGGFYPGTVDCFSQLVLQGGDVFGFIDENGNTQTMIITHMTTMWNGMADCLIECTGNQYRNDDANNGYKEKLRSGRKYHDFIVDIDQLYSEIGDLDGNISQINQTVESIESTVKASQSTQILRGTNKLDTLNLSGTTDNHWENEKWVRDGAAENYALMDLTNPPVPVLKRMVQITSSTTQQLIYQDKIPLASTYGVTSRYTLSYWYRIVSGTPINRNVYIYARESDQIAITVPKTNQETEWTHATYTVTCNTNNGTFGIGLAPNANCVIQICGMKLEMGEENTQWSEADVFSQTKIIQTANSIETKINDALGNYMNRTETQDYVTTEMGNALQDYSTTNQTAELIALYVGNNAYQLVSGISITSAGVDITGSKYVKLSSNGYVGCGDYWRFESDGLWYLNDDYANVRKMYIGETKSSYANDIYSAITSDYSVSSTPGAPSNNDITGTIEFYIRSVFNLDSAGHYSEMLGTKVRFYTNSIGYLQFYPIWDSAESDVLGNGSLGISYYPWGYGYINEIHYKTLVQMSSREEKHDIKPMPDMGNIIDQLKPVTYVYNTDLSEHKRYGLIHEDTIDVFPDICIGKKKDDPEKKSINYVELITVLLKEVQSLRARVAALEGGENHD